MLAGTLKGSRSVVTAYMFCCVVLSYIYNHCGMCEEFLEFGDRFV